MPVFGPGFHISFDFFIKSHVAGNSGGYSWIFGNNNDGDMTSLYGEPAIWINSQDQKVYMYFPLNSDQTYDFAFDVLPQVWYKLEYSSYEENTLVFKVPYDKSV